MKIEIDIEKSSTIKGQIYFSPENDSDIFLLGKLVEKLGKTETKFIYSTDDPESKLKYIMFTKEVLLDYLLNSRKIIYKKL